jgi:hypothetical protein
MNVPYPPPAYEAEVPTKKKRRTFMWVFLAIQALMLVWIIAGASSASGAPTDCGSLSAQACNDVPASFGLRTRPVTTCANLPRDTSHDHLAESFGTALTLEQ